MDIYREATTLLFGFLLLVAALNSLIKLSESVLSMLSDFESMVQKNSSKSVPAGDWIHDLTLHMMNYLSLLTDYSNVLVDIITDWPSSAKSSHPESYFDNPVSDESPASAISTHMAWLVLVLLCKLNDKAKHYKDVILQNLSIQNHAKTGLGWFWFWVGGRWK
ncbi:hypothetical protein PS1_010961 [Malus domestica]